MTLPDFLVSDPYGEILLTGHRITLYHVVSRYLEGYSAEMIVDYYPTLPPALVYKALAFYLENQAEVDEYVRTTRAEIDRQAAMPQRGPSFEEFKRRMAMRTSVASP